MFSTTILTMMITGNRNTFVVYSHWIGHTCIRVIRTGEMRNVHKILVVKFEGKKQLRKSTNRP
jgi:hypothetical protein